MVDTPFLTEPNVPRVAIMGPPLYKGIDAGVSIGSQFEEKALGYLAARGRRRIAVLSTPSGYRGGTEPIRSVLAAHHMRCPPCWDIAMSLDAVAEVKNVVRLLMRSGQTDRPDGLLIMNDHLVDHAVAGLVAEGIRVPDDLEVVTHCNFPWPQVKMLPIRRLGVDVRAVVRVAIDLIDRKRAGQDIPANVSVPAAWEEDVHTEPATQHERSR